MHASETADTARLRRALAPVQAAATRLPWADERRWTGQSHVWDEGGLPVVDLHDLSVKLARQAVDAVAGAAPELSAGAVCFVTGRGTHSLGPARLGRAVSGALGHVARAHGWRHGLLRPGRQVLIFDPRRAPAAATGRLGWPFWLGLALFGAAATFAWPPAGLLVLAFFALAAWIRRSPRG